MKKISVAIAVFNEEENIGDCLKTVKNWVDEIVVVDGGSNDKTIQIVEKYGAKVVVTDNPPIFHINKQKAIDACQGEWILQLDADERVPSKLRQEILRVTAAAPRRSPSAGSGHRSRSRSKFNGFWLPRRNYFLGRFLTKGGQYPDYTLRLYRRGKGHLPCQSVHEQAVVKGKVGYLKNDLLHLADPNFSRYLLRFNRYTSLIASELAEEKIKINPASGLNYILIKPIGWFLETYFRHRGFADGFPGFVFAFFSGLRFAVGYIKYWEKKNKNESSN